MPSPSRSAACLFLLSCAAACSVLPAQANHKVFEAIAREGIERSQVMTFQDVLCHDFGSRLTGSLAGQRAAEWARDQFAAMGLDAKLEPWGEWQVWWDREQWMGRVLSPFELELQVACPAWTGSTRGIGRGTLVPMPTNEEEANAIEQRQLGGEAFWLWGPLPPDEALRNLVRGLLDRGIVHGLVQSAASTGWNDKNYENQLRVFGDMRQALRPYGERPRFAHAVVRDDQAAKIEAAFAGAAPIVVEFELRNRFRPGPVPLCNVVAELRGSERPDEVVIVCGHLDSWHQATGATDNGTGTCSTLEVARILTAVAAKPKRTIRFVLWTGEEQGLLGSRQYVVMHRRQMHKVSAVFNHDGGTNWVQSLRVAASHASDLEPIAQQIRELLRPPQQGFEPPVFQLHAEPVLQPAGGGSDHASFGAVGVPAFAWGQTGEVPYARGWHSQWDTWSIVVPHYQAHTATVIAMVAFGVADLDHLLSRDGVERAQPRGPVTAQLVLETWLGVELDGLRVGLVADGGIAAAAGLRTGDVMQGVGDTAVDGQAALLTALRAAWGNPGAVSVTVLRDGQQAVIVLRKG